MVAGDREDGVVQHAEHNLLQDGRVFRIDQLCVGIHIGCQLLEVASFETFQQTVRLTDIQEGLGILDPGTVPALRLRNRSASLWAIRALPLLLPSGAVVHVFL